MRLARARASFDAALARWTRRRQGEDRCPFALQRRRLYVLPTRFGAGYAVITLGAVIAGLNYANSLALLLAFSMVGFAIVVMNLCHRNLLGLTVEAVRAEPAFAGTACSVHIVLANAGLEPRGDLSLATGEARAVCEMLEGGQQSPVTLELLRERRGVEALGALRLESTYPFGLFRCWTWLHVPVELIAYPRCDGHRPLPLRSLRVPDERLGMRADGGDEWRDLRAFREGDSPRQVAWKAYARGAPLLVREYGRAARTSVHLTLEATGRANREAAFSQLARWVVDAESRGVRYRMTVDANDAPEDGGLRHRRRCLEMLARAS